MKYGLLSIFILLTSCVHGPKAERKSVLNYLNGQHYSQSANVLGVPVIQRQSVVTTVSGTVLFDAGGLPFPVKNQHILILNAKGTAVAAAFTADDGSFQLRGILENGTYRLYLNSTKYEGELRFRVDSYQISGLRIHASEKQAASKTSKYKSVKVSSNP